MIVFLFCGRPRHRAELVAVAEQVSKEPCVSELHFAFRNRVGQQCAHDREGCAPWDRCAVVITERFVQAVVASVVAEHARVVSGNSEILHEEQIDDLLGHPGGLVARGFISIESVIHRVRRRALPHAVTDPALVVAFADAFHSLALPVMEIKSRAAEKIDFINIYHFQNLFGELRGTAQSDFYVWGLFIDGCNGCVDDRRKLLRGPAKLGFIVHAPVTDHVLVVRSHAADVVLPLLQVGRECMATSNRSVLRLGL